MSLHLNSNVQAVFINEAKLEHCTLSRVGKGCENIKLVVKPRLGLDHYSVSLPSARSYGRPKFFLGHEQSRLFNETSP